MAKILIIGYGNPLRSDDGLGWHAADELANGAVFADAEIIKCVQLTPELADNIHSADLVFFVDASRVGEPGELSLVPLAETAATPFSHDPSATAILALVRQLYGSAPPAYLATVAGENFEFGEQLSPKVATALPRLTALISETAERVSR